jgi:predicted transcriptional regulator of viral defense system
MNPASPLIPLLEHHHGLLRRQDVVTAGINPFYLTQAVREGWLERSGRGVYQLSEPVMQPTSRWFEWLIVQAQIPKGVVCLLSSAFFHELTTTVPNALYLALPKSAWRIPIAWPPIRYVHFSEPYYHVGLEQHSLEGGILQVYSPEKTVVDLLRLQKTYGEALFLEVLKNYLRSSTGRVSRLLEIARACKVEPLMAQYTRVVLA